MGQIAVYKCKNCGNEFGSQEGGGFSFAEYRCVDCDEIKVIKTNRAVPANRYVPPTKNEIGKCKKCGGELKDDIKPMCPKCKSRDVETKEVTMNYD